MTDLFGEDPMQRIDALEAATLELNSKIQELEQIVLELSGSKGKTSRSKPKRPIPEDWWPDAKDTQYGKDRLMTEPDIQQQVCKFRDYFISKGIVRASWSASWRQWVTNWTEYNAELIAKRKQALARDANTTEFEG